MPRETKAHVTIYTDGSATGGTTAGGAAMVATKGDPADAEIFHTSKARAAELTSSYEDETGQGLTAPLSASQYALTANSFLRLFRAAHTTPSLFASD